MATPASARASVGVVWLALGSATLSLAQPADQGEHPDIRLFQVAYASETRLATEVGGSWQRCTPETAPGFSAVAYFFGRLPVNVTFFSFIWRARS